MSRAAVRERPDPVVAAQEIAALTPFLKVPKQRHI
jgi:hypothetical protein